MKWFSASGLYEKTTGKREKNFRPDLFCSKSDLKNSSSRLPCARSASRRLKGMLAGKDLAGRILKHPAQYVLAYA